MNGPALSVQRGPAELEAENTHLWGVVSSLRRENDRLSARNAGLTQQINQMTMESVDVG